MDDGIKQNLVGSLIRILNIFGVTKADVNDICNRIMVEYVEYFEVPMEVNHANNLRKMHRRPKLSE